MALRFRESCVLSISQSSRTGDDKVSDAVIFWSAGCQANDAKSFHKLGGFNKYVWTEEGQLDQTVTLFDCAFTSLKVEAHSEIHCRSVFSISKMRMTVTSRSLMTGRPIMQTCLAARRVEHAWAKERERERERESSIAPE